MLVVCPGAVLPEQRGDHAPHLAWGVISLNSAIGTDGRVPLVPMSDLLVGVAHSQRRGFVERWGHDLQAGRQTIRGEAHGHRQRRQLGEAG